MKNPIYMQTIENAICEINTYYNKVFDLTSECRNFHFMY